MKILFTFFVLSLSLSSLAVDYGYLEKKDMPYYKNDSLEGNNKMERIDSLVKEVNKIYGELIQMKSEMAKLKEEMALLKAKK